jgi:deazaflavin-dependent oxidoreductase (nitroreductase family)
MSAVKDRPIKRRIEILVGRYTVNPLMRALFRLGITPPGMVLVETVGRRSGLTRQTPVNGSVDGRTLWLIAQHGAHAGWVRNFQAKPEVRVRLGRRWQTGTAELRPEDDVKTRIDTFSANPVGKLVNRISFRALESQPVVVRIALGA